MKRLVKGPIVISHLDGIVVGRGQGEIRLGPDFGGRLPTATASAWGVVPEPSLLSPTERGRYRMTFEDGRSCEVTFPNGVDVSGARFNVVLESQLT